MDAYSFLSVSVVSSGTPIFESFWLNILFALLTVWFMGSHVVMNLYMIVGTSTRLTKKL